MSRPRCAGHPDSGSHNTPGGVQHGATAHASLSHSCGAGSGAGAGARHSGPGTGSNGQRGGGGGGGGMRPVGVGAGVSGSLARQGKLVPLSAARSTQRKRPRSSEAKAPRGGKDSGATVQGSAKRAARRRSASGDDSTPRAPATCPAWELARSTAIDDVLSAFAEACSRHRVNRATKTARHIHRLGYRDGLRGVFGRWLFHQKEAEIEADSGVDPIIPSPSGADEHVAQELVDAGVSPVAATSLSQLLCDVAAHAAAAMAKRTGQSPVDEELAVRVSVVEHAPRPHRLLSHAGTTLRLNEAHYRKLARLYRATARGCGQRGSARRDDDSMHAAMFCVVSRYETLSACSSGYQGALPDAAFEALRSLFGVTHECFASPLNCYLDSYCSMFPDTDACFGSAGPFFAFHPATGSFECNPPFVNEVMDATARHVEGLLRAATGPLSFVVVLPAWDDLRCDWYRTLTTSAFLRRRVRLERKAHKYKDGMQHRVDRETWDANVGSLCFWMQNDGGYSAWPPSDAAVRSFQAAANK